MNQSFSEKDDRSKHTKERQSMHDKIHRALSAKMVHTPAFIVRLIVIFIGLLITYSFLQEILQIRDSLSLHSSYDSYEKLLNKLKLNNPAPLRDEGSKASSNQIASICRIGDRVIKPIKTFRTPMDHPTPAVGSKDLFNSDKCTTYADRYHPYDDESLQMTYLQGYAPLVEQSRRSYWNEAERAEMNAKLIETNLKAEVKGGYHDWAKVIEDCRGQGEKAKRALVLRAYENYTWGLDDIRNVRALVVELALNPEPKDRYDVHLLVEVHTRNSSFAMSEKERTAILQRSVPREFWSLITLWNEAEMTWLYPYLPGNFLNHMIATNSYRSCFMPVQVFSKNHPQYDFVWNWEMDTRSTQEYGEILERISNYANRAPIDQLLDHQMRWLIPASSTSTDRSEGEDADLITLNPFFNTYKSGYYWAYDFQNFAKDTLHKSSIGKNVQFSKRLLKAMSDANADEKISAHCENFAATILVRKSRSEKNSDWKGVYVPHPIYTRHIWPDEQLSKAVNRDDIYRKVNERVLREFSFYYDGAHAKDIYDAWRKNKNACRAPNLLHPIKRQP